MRVAVAEPPERGGGPGSAWRAASRVEFILPNDIDDPARPSGGNVYDRRVIDGLRARGWSVQEHAVPGDWPRPSVAQRVDLAARLDALPDDALVVVDGLVGSAVPGILQVHQRRLRLVLLMHMPLGDMGSAGDRDREAQSLSAASSVLATSRWSAARLRELYTMPLHRLHVAPPGVDPAPLAPGSPGGTRLLCVAAVTHHKGHDVLVRALAGLRDLPFGCVFVGTLDREPSFVESLVDGLRAAGISDRVSFAGAQAGKALRSSYARADLLVLPSRGETYGMVVTEALAYGIPVVTTDGKGLPEAVGRAPDGSRPGLLVPPDDAAALASALRLWLGSPGLRARLRASAQGRRTTLAPWSRTTAQVATALAGVRRGR